MKKFTATTLSLVITIATHFSMDAIAELPEQDDCKVASEKELTQKEVDMLSQLFEHKLILKEDDVDDIRAGTYFNTHALANEHRSYIEKVIIHPSAHGKLKSTEPYFQRFINNIISATSKGRNISVIHASEKSDSLEIRFPENVSFFVGNDNSPPEETESKNEEE